MSKFIPIDKMKKLREAGKNGDAKALKILRAQMNDEDYDGLLEDFFKPAPEAAPVEVSTGASGEKTKINNQNLLKFLQSNGINENSSDYDEYVEEYYKEFPNERPEKTEEENISVFDALIDDEKEAIEGYNKAIMEIMNDDSRSDSERKGIIASLEDIKREEVEHLEKLKRMKTDSVKKEEKEEGIVD